MELGTLFPPLFLLSCALMMIFMMRGHGHEGHGTQALQPTNGAGSRGDEREKPETGETAR